MSRKYIDLSGKRFNRLIVIEHTASVNGRTHWICRCDCGKVTSISASNIKAGQKSCGCANLEPKNKTHGQTGTPEYIIWIGIIDRTTNIKGRNYPKYGGRGITLCNRWRKFINFIADMGKRPNRNYSVERLNNDKGYSPQNCVWATRSTQQRNKRTNVHITIDGVTKLLIDWYKESPTSSSTYYRRKQKGFTDRQSLGL